MEPYGKGEPSNVSARHSHPAARYGRSPPSRTAGTRGTVDHVDDGGNIHMKWDNGRTLSLCSDADSFRTLTAAELAEEQAERQQDSPTEDEGQDEDEAPVMSM